MPPVQTESGPRAQPQAQPQAQPPPQPDQVASEGPSPNHSQAQPAEASAQLEIHQLLGSVIVRRDAELDRETADCTARLARLHHESEQLEASWRWLLEEMARLRAREEAVERLRREVVEAQRAGQQLRGAIDDAWFGVGLERMELGVQHLPVPQR